MTSGIELIAEERNRQMAAEGWTLAHDDAHLEAELPRAAGCYLGHAIGSIAGMALQETIPAQWPWQRHWWKPSNNPVRDLVKAGALIAAEIDRLHRERAKPQAGDSPLIDEMRALLGRPGNSAMANELILQAIEAQRDAEKAPPSC